MLCWSLDALLDGLDALLDFFNALLNGEDIASAGRHLVLAYRYSMTELASMMPKTSAELLLEARKVDTSFLPLSDSNVANALTVWFLAESSLATTKPGSAQTGGRMRTAGGNGGANEHANGKNLAGAAGMKRTGTAVSAPKAPLVPGKLYFGFCEEVIRALQKIVGEASSKGSGEGRGLCKIEYDAATNLPVTPIQVIAYEPNPWCPPCVPHNRSEEQRLAAKDIVSSSSH